MRTKPFGTILVGRIFWRFWSNRAGGRSGGRRSDDSRERGEVRRVVQPPRLEDDGLDVVAGGRVHRRRRPAKSVVGRDAIAKQLDHVFAGAEDAKLTVTVDSIDFVSPNVAVEKGTAEVTYSKIADGENRIHGRAREARRQVAARPRDGHRDRRKATRAAAVELRTLEGTRVDDRLLDRPGRERHDPDRLRVDQEPQLHDALVRHGHRRPGQYVGHADRRLGPGRQADSLLGVRFRRRLFRRQVDAQRRQVDRFNKRARCPTAARPTATNIFTHVDDNSFTWQSINRTVDGEMLPNIDEVLIVRKPAE